MTCGLKFSVAFYDGGNVTSGTNKCEAFYVGSSCHNRKSL